MDPQLEAVDFEFRTSRTHELYINCKQCGSQAYVESLGQHRILTTCKRCNVAATWTIVQPGSEPTSRAIKASP